MIYKNGVIKGFNGGNYFLSNFLLHRVEYKSLVYPSSENAFQASKCIDDDDRESFQMLSPSDAKFLGGTLVRIVGNWDYIKFEIMTEILIEKFRDKRLQKMLGDTYPKYLLEGNTWHDNIWGDCTCRKGKCKVTGLNWLGKVLMNIRKDIVEG